MKIIVADPISEQGLALLRGKGWEVLTPDKNELAVAIADADALIVRSATRVTSELLEGAKQLRVVGRAGVGVDNVDLAAATRRGVLVMNTPGGNAVSVAEHALALMMSLARRIPQLSAAIHAGRWEKSGGTGTELRGKTLGLLGFGRVGHEVAQRARGLEMHVIAHDPYVSETAALDAGVKLLPLDDILAQSDYISLHLALSPATAKIINAVSLAKCKRGASLINTARGELVDEAALAEALRSGQLAGAALDVFAVEPPRDSPLIGLAQCDWHAARRRLDARGAGRSGHADRATSARLSGRRRVAQFRQSAFAFGRAIPSHQALDRGGRALGRVRGAGGRRTL